MTRPHPNAPNWSRPPGAGQSAPTVDGIDLSRPSTDHRRAASPMRCTSTGIGLHRTQELDHAGQIRSPARRRAVPTPTRTTMPRRRATPESSPWTRAHEQRDGKDNPCRRAANTATSRRLATSGVNRGVPPPDPTAGRNGARVRRSTPPGPPVAAPPWPVPACLAFTRTLRDGTVRRRHEQPTGSDATADVRTPASRCTRCSACTVTG